MILVIHYSLGVSSNNSIFFLSSCCLFILHNRLWVLFYALFNWHDCIPHYCWFSKPKYSFFNFLVNPVVDHYLASTPEAVLCLLRSVSPARTQLLYLSVSHGVALVVDLRNLRPKTHFTLYGLVPTKPRP